MEDIKKPLADQEIDLIEIVLNLWHKRKFIIKVTVVFACVGIFYALTRPVEYTATCMMVPQTSSKSVNSSLGGLAAMAGIDLNLGSSSGELLSPVIYPEILSSIPFQKELMQTPVKFAKYDQPVKLLDYFTDKEYQKISLLGVIKKYTIGLPGVIIGAFKSKKEPLVVSSPVSSSIQVLTEEERVCMRILTHLVTLQLNEKNRSVSLSAKMPEPYAAAQLAAAAQLLLQKYVTKFKIQKVQSNLDFVEERYEEARQKFETSQKALAAFRDANRNVVSALARTQEETLTNEYNLAFAIYSELSKQREQVGIQVKEITPMFTVIEPVTVPTDPSAPKRGFIYVVFVFMGGFVGAGWVIIRPVVIQIFKPKNGES